MNDSFKLVRDYCISRGPYRSLPIVQPQVYQRLAIIDNSIAGVANLGTSLGVDVPRHAALNAPNKPVDVFAARQAIAYQIICAITAACALGVYDFLEDDIKRQVESSTQ